MFKRAVRNKILTQPLFFYIFLLGKSEIGAKIYWNVQTVSINLYKNRHWTTLTSLISFYAVFRNSSSGFLKDISKLFFECWLPFLTFCQEVELWALEKSILHFKCSKVYFYCTVSVFGIIVMLTLVHTIKSVPFLCLNDSQWLNKLKIHSSENGLDWLKKQPMSKSVWLLGNKI